MTRPAMTPDSFAAYLITDLAKEARQDPPAFLKTCDDLTIDGFADIAVIDEFDCPDDLFWLFEVGDDFDFNTIKHNDRTFAMIRDAIQTLHDELKG